MNADTTSIKFVIGSRKVFEVRRQLRTVSCGLQQLIDSGTPDFGPDDPALDGYRVLSVSELIRAEAVRRFPRHIMGGLQRYRRHYIDMSGSYVDYLAHFSGKTRSTFNRKRRRLAAMAGGALTIEEFRTPDEVERFFIEAMPLSRQTYQARLLDAGLPEGHGAIEAALGLAAEDRLRAFMLRLGARPIAYLYLPVQDTTLMYAFLGYDTEFARYSPGVVLHLQALERLFAEGRYRYFDFTEGEGAHKTMFGTNWVDACSFFLLRARLRNRLLLTSLDAFDGFVANTKWLVAQSGTLARVRRVLRS